MEVSKRVRVDCSASRTSCELIVSCCTINVLTYEISQHRVSPFRLVDPTKPGHRRFIALWLVDPNFRIISTANVPPQQMNWWTGSVFGDTQEAREQARSKLPSDVVTWLHEQSPADVPQLPRELMDMVSEYVTTDYNEMPMSEEEARHHRKELMEERSNSHSSAESEWNGYSYNFCEH
jgi:septum formation topological specificity factor MinE